MLSTTDLPRTVEDALWAAQVALDRAVELLAAGQHPLHPVEDLAVALRRHRLSIPVKVTVTAR